FEIRASRDPQPRANTIAESKSPLKTLASVLLDVTRLRPKAFDVVCQLQGGLELEMTWRTPVSETLEMPTLSTVHTGARQPLALARVG
ncbi:MAG: hypothetical protein JWN70_5276, partial [Planctomycetaceae bacterium]|nr:hypothetical protein [Planctomycetaceae bacterium]